MNTTNWYLIVLLTAAVFVNVLVYMQVSDSDQDSGAHPLVAVVAAIKSPTRERITRYTEAVGREKMGPDLFEYTYDLPRGDRRVRSRRLYRRSYHRRTYRRSYRRKPIRRRAYARRSTRRYRPYISHTQGSRDCCKSDSFNPFYQDTDRWRVMY